MAAWQRCMARSETTLASKMSVFGHEQESVEVVVRDLRNRLKRVIGEVARYPTEHDEKSIPDRSLRCRMGLYRAPPPHSKVRRTPADPFSARDPRRRLLHRSQWLRLAPVTPRFPALEDRLPLLSPLAHRWHLGEAQCGHPPAPARAPRA